MHTDRWTTKMIKRAGVRVSSTSCLRKSKITSRIEVGKRYSQECAGISCVSCLRELTRHVIKTQINCTVSPLLAVLVSEFAAPLQVYIATELSAPHVSTGAPGQNVHVALQSSGYAGFCKTSLVPHQHSPFTCGEAATYWGSAWQRRPQWEPVIFVSPVAKVVHRVVWIHWHFGEVENGRSARFAKLVGHSPVFGVGGPFQDASATLLIPSSWTLPSSSTTIEKGPSARSLVRGYVLCVE